jgi:hypothetical protein
LPEDLKNRFLKRAGLPADASLWEIVEALRAIPYGRPAARNPEGTVQEWVGTCSTKHALLAELLADRPELDVELVHRVYRIDPTRAQELFGDEVAKVVPSEGLVDVHRYATVVIDGRRTRIDVTFPGPLWDGRSDMPLCCGPGTDHAVPPGADPVLLKRQLEEAHCDPAVREPFIAGLTASAAR